LQKYCDSSGSWYNRYYTSGAVHIVGLSRSLRGNGTGEESFAGVLGRCPALTHLNLILNLSLNHFGATGAESLAGVLAQCTSLAHLNLRYNGIGDAGAERLAGLMGQCPVLTHLDLSDNEDEDEDEV
jgi:hypothetical protein